MRMPQRHGSIDRPVGIDLFSGAGGFSLGFEQAGFDVVAAVDLDPIHAATHLFDFPSTAVLPRSVTELSGREIREAAGLGRKHVDVVFGGAPCQGFSLIGHRVLDDPRNALAKEFVRIVSELGASYFVFENVKGLTIGRHRQFLDELVAAFDTCGYRAQLPWRVLNASSFGVPQERERLFLIGGKKSLPLPQYPDPITCAAGSGSDLLSLPVGPSCREALGDLPAIEEYPELFLSDHVEADSWGKAGAYAREMRCLERGAWHFGYARDWNRSLLTSSLRTRHSDISKRRFAETAPGDVEPVSRFFKLPPDGVSNTLRAGTDSARGAFTSPRPVHYSQPRCVTVREMARLHGFPDWFRFHVTKWHGARQIGNAVPPPLARIVAAKIMQVLGVVPATPKDRLSLGDPVLLEMDMSQVCKFWGIAIPIGRRDRKSGARKRKQHEIEAIRLRSGEEAVNG